MNQQPRMRSRSCACCSLSWASESLKARSASTSTSSSSPRRYAHASRGAATWHSSSIHCVRCRRMEPYRPARAESCADPARRRRCHCARRTRRRAPVRYAEHTERNERAAALAGVADVTRAIVARAQIEAGGGSPGSVGGPALCADAGAGATAGIRRVVHRCRRYRRRVGQMQCGLSRAGRARMILKCDRAFGVDAFVDCRGAQCVACCEGRQEQDDAWVTHEQDITLRRALAPGMRNPLPLAGEGW